MKISELNTKVMLQQKCAVSDGLGGYITEWLDKEEIWANVTSIKAKPNQKTIRSKKTTHQIIIRTRPDITNHFRVKVDGNFFDFDNIDFLDETKRFQKISAIQRYV